MGPACKSYANVQPDAETKVQGVREAHAEAGTDAGPAEASIALIGRLFTPVRYLPPYGFQQVEACMDYTAPRPHITNAASLSTADFLRRVVTIAYRTRELRIARPESGIGSAERSLRQERVTDTGTTQAG